MKEERLIGYHTSFGEVIRAQEYGLLATYRKIKPEDRANAVFAALKEAITQMDENAALKLLELYRRALIDLALLKYLRKDEREGEYFVQPEGEFPDFWKFNLGRYMTIFSILPDRWPIGGGGSDTFAFPKLKEGVLQGIKKGMDRISFFSFLLTIPTRFNEGNDLVRKFVRSACDGFENIEKCEETLKSVAAMSFVDTETFSVALKSLYIARIRMAKISDLKAQAISG